MLRNLLLAVRPRAGDLAPGPDALVQVHLRAGQLYVEPSDRTRLAEAGYWVTTGEVTVLAADGPDAALGDAILAALARSRVEVAVPPPGARLQAGLFRAMGVRSLREAMTGTATCALSRDPARRASHAGPAMPARLVIEVANHVGARREDGSVPGPSAIELPVASTPSAIGRSVRMALQHASVSR